MARLGGNTSKQRFDVKRYHDLVRIHKQGADPFNERCIILDCIYYSEEVAGCWRGIWITHMWESNGVHNWSEWVVLVVNFRKAIKWSQLGLGAMKFVIELRFQLCLATERLFGLRCWVPSFVNSVVMDIDEDLPKWLFCTSLYMFLYFQGSEIVLIGMHTKRDKIFNI